MRMTNPALQQLLWVVCACVCLASSAWAQTFNDPVAYWKLDENSGTTPADSTGNGHGMTFNTAPDAPTWMTGANCKFSSCLSFDGTDLATFTAMNMGTTWTFATWLYISTGATEAYGGLMGQIYVMQTQSPNCQLNVWYSTDHFSSSGVPLTTWTHVGVVSNAGAITFYINGTASGTAASAPSMSMSTLGGTGDPSENLLGRMDDVRLYSRALNAADMSALAAFVPSSGTPVVRRRPIFIE